MSYAKKMKLHQPLVWTLMLFTILGAFVLRVDKLGTDASFTADELTTVTSSMHSVAEMWRLQSKTPLQALWIRFGAQGLGLGYTEYGVYFMSVIAGVLAVIVVYRLGKLMFDRYVGLLSAFMLAFSAYHIYWSRSARYYALMVLLSSLAFLFLNRAISTNEPKAWLGYALFRTLSLYDHLTALLVLIGEVGFALVFISSPLLRELWEYRHLKLGALTRVWQNTRAQFRNRGVWYTLVTSTFFRFAITMLFIGFAFSPRWYPVVHNALLGTSNLQVPFLSSELTASTGPAIRDQLYVSLQSPFIILELFDGWNPSLHAIMMIGFIGGCLCCVLRRQWAQLFFVLTLMITPFIVLAAIAAIGYRKPINGRYLISLLPLYYVMVGRGWSGLSHKIVRSIRILASYRVSLLWGLFGALLVAYAWLSADKAGFTRWNVGQNWRGVGHFLAQTAQPEQLIVVDGKPTHVKALQYYMDGFNVVSHDPNVSYDALYRQEEEGFWLVFQFGTDIYSGLKRWADNRNSVALIFSGGWYPDITKTTALRPAQSWDLYVVYVNRSIGSPEEALNLYQAWLPQAETHHLRGHLTRAEAYQRFDQPGLAIPEYTLALNEEYVNDQLTSYIYDARGRSLHKLGQIEQAIADWQQAIARAEWSQEPYKHLGSVLIQTGRADAAQALYQVGISANPKKAWPHVLLGDYYLSAGLDGQAINKYNRAIEIEPHDQITHQRLGERYAATGEYTRGISLYRDAIRRNPWSSWPHFQLGQFYQSQGQVAEAVVEYQKAVELNPEYTPSVSRFLRDARWNLEAVLNFINVYSDQGELLWWPGYSWVRPFPYDHEVIVGHSMLAVESRIRPNQILIHPFSDQENTYIEFEIQDNSFAYLQVGYGLADEVAGLSNGVQYTVEIRRQGSSDYEPLFTQTVTQNLWQERVVSLASNWGEDLAFRIIVDAKGDYAYDWLQTTVELIPPPHSVWTLSAHLSEAQFLPEGLPLEWQGDGLYTTDSVRLLGSSELTVAGQNLSDQIHLHPYSSEIDSTIVITLTHHPYRLLVTSYGLADQAMPYSNGVEYTVSVSSDGGQSFQDLIQTIVETNTWQTALATLPPSQDLVLKISASARQDETYDWLQIRLFLLPIDGYHGFVQPIPANEAGG